MESSTIIIGVLLFLLVLCVWILILTAQEAETWRNRAIDANVKLIHQKPHRDKKGRFIKNNSFKKV